MADWALGPNNTLTWTGSGGAPLLSGSQQVAMRNQLRSAPAQQAPAPSRPSSPPLQSGNTQAAQRAGGAQNIMTGGIHPSGLPASSFPHSGTNGQGSPDLFGGDSDILPGARVIPTPGGRTVLNPNGVSFFIPDNASSSGGGGGGGGGGGSGGGPPPGGGPTKVLGPQTAHDLLPAFSPPAINQFPNFYDPSAYKPVAGSTGAQGLPASQTNPDIGGQASIAQMLGQPWYARSLTLTPGQNGYGMPAGNDLKNNTIDPRVYGYIAPTLAPAYYQNARSTAK